MSFSRLDITKTFPPLIWWLYDRVIAERIDGINADLIAEVATGVPAGGLVLDVGCGGGQLAITLARQQLQVVGVDADKGQVRRANRRAQSESGRVLFEHAMAEDLPFVSESFDAVVSVGSLKHWPHPEAGLAEMVRVLRPGGQLRVLEAARGSSTTDSHTTVQRLRYPRALRGIGAYFFRVCVAGTGISVEEARAMTHDLALADVVVKLMPDAPAFWEMSGCKRTAFDAGVR